LIVSNEPPQDKYVTKLLAGIAASPTLRWAPFSWWRRDGTFFAG
jgi:hypothetical protein